MVFPKEFTEYTSLLFGEERWQRYLASVDEPVPVSIRYNPFKVGMTEEMTGLFSEHTLVPWCRNAYWLRQRPLFTTDPFFHAGRYYVQEAGSMFLDEVLRQHITSSVAMLDLCAAPGGKSTLARAALPAGSLLFANEPDRRRANILLENIQKQGHPDVVVTNNYPHHYARTKLLFDVILADVPCSGEGLFRRDPKAVAEWSVTNVQKCATLQRQIITDIWDRLRPGGLLVYSTCTFNLHENEENILYICEELGADVVSVEIGDDWGITPSLHPQFDGPVYRFIPGTSRSEGLFMAVLRKHGDSCIALLKREKMLSQCKGLNVMYDGVPREEQRGKAFVPSHAEALSLSLDRTKYAECKVSLDDALRYLHHETLTLAADVPRGYVLLTYKNIPIGFVKNIGNRANNLYPKEWAIRMDVRP